MEQPKHSAVDSNTPILRGRSLRQTCSRFPPLRLPIPQSSATYISGILPYRKAGMLPGGGERFAMNSGALLDLLLNPSCRKGSSWFPNSLGLCGWTIDDDSPSDICNITAKYP